MGDWTETLARLRGYGWAVAVHNDYRMQGHTHTFWLLTHPDGRYIKGEGTNDDVALAQCEAAAEALLSAPSDLDAERAKTARLREVAQPIAVFINAEEVRGANPEDLILSFKGGGGSGELRRGHLRALAAALAPDSEPNVFRDHIPNERTPTLPAGLSVPLRLRTAEEELAERREKAAVARAAVDIGRTPVGLAPDSEKEGGRD